jgi:hypothetical protein
MSEEPETTLRQSLDAVDRFRTRVIAGVVFFFVTTALALASLMGAAAARVTGDAGQTKILFASVAAQMLFVALCTVVVTLFINRMTKTILRAIELSSK